MAMRWYVVHAYSGYEKRVAESLKERIQFEGMEDSFGEVLVPTEEVVEVRDGKKRKSERKFYPGYVMVQMEMNDETWHLVKQIPRVMGFIGGTADKPAPITEREAEAILRRVQDVQISHLIKQFTNLVRLCVSLKGPLPTLMVWLRVWIMTSRAY